MKLYQVIGAAALGVGLIATPPAHAKQQQDTKKPVSEMADTLAISKFYVGPAHEGQFSGTLVNISCHNNPGMAADQACGNTAGYHPALKMADGRIYPLLAPSKRIFNELQSADRRDKTLNLYGRMYPGIGMIMVTKVSTGATQQPGSQAQ